LHDWLEVSLTKLSRKSDTTAAIRYALTLWSALTRFCDERKLEIDNNAAERSLRAVLWVVKIICSPGPILPGESVCHPL